MSSSLYEWGLLLFIYPMLAVFYVAYGAFVNARTMHDFSVCAVLGEKVKCLLKLRPRIFRASMRRAAQPSFGMCIHTVPYATTRVWPAICFALLRSSRYLLRVVSPFHRRRKQPMRIGVLTIPCTRCVFKVIGAIIRLTRIFVVDNRAFRARADERFGNQRVNGSRFILAIFRYPNGVIPPRQVGSQYSAHICRSVWDYSSDLAYITNLVGGPFDYRSPLFELDRHGVFPFRLIIPHIQREFIL